MSKHVPSKKLSVLHDEFLAFQDRQAARTLCANCDWAHEGTALEGHEAFHAHRLEVHPEIRPPKRRQRGYSISVAARKRAAESQKAA